jgi:hypothetical protein
VLWSDEKIRLKIEAVKALTIVKTHFKDSSCPELLSKILEKKKSFWNRFKSLINI